MKRKKWLQLSREDLKAQLAAAKQLYSTREEIRIKKDSETHEKRNPDGVDDEISENLTTTLG